MCQLTSSKQASTHLLMHTPGVRWYNVFRWLRCLQESDLHDPPPGNIHFVGCLQALFWKYTISRDGELFSYRYPALSGPRGPRCYCNVQTVILCLLSEITFPVKVCCVPQIDCSNLGHHHIPLKIDLWSVQLCHFVSWLSSHHRHWMKWNLLQQTSNI